MNRYVFMMALLCSNLTLQAAVLNGFQPEKIKLEREIRDLEELILKTPDSKNIRTLEKQLKKLEKQYAMVLQKYTETAQLINTVAKVDPELFLQVSNITNAEGTLTSVIVRYVSRVSKEFTYFTSNFYIADAYTSVGQSGSDENVCTSRYGTNTITITVGYGVNEVKALGHEFAHVMYMVPNLKQYMDFQNHSQEFINGHSDSDPGYYVIHQIENRFLENYMEYMKIQKGKTDSLEPMVLNQ